MQAKSLSVQNIKIWIQKGFEIFSIGAALAFWALNVAHAQTVNANTMPACRGTNVEEWHRCVGWGAFDDGGNYNGEFSNGKINGRGELTKKDGTRFVGNFRDGKIDGTGTVTYPNGSSYIGEFRDGLFDGVGKLTYSNGATFEGDFRRGAANGRGIYREQGRIRYEGEVKENSFNGRGVVYEQNGDRIEGEFIGGKIEGRFTKYFASGYVLRGEMREGRIYPDQPANTSNEQDLCARNGYILGTQGHRDCEQKLSIAKGAIKDAQNKYEADLLRYQKELERQNRQRESDRNVRIMELGLSIMGGSSGANITRQIRPPLPPPQLHQRFILPNGAMITCRGSEGTVVFCN
jgi:hypothetical protein